MVTITVEQLIDGSWERLGDVFKPARASAEILLDDLQQAMKNPETVNLPLRLSSGALLVVRLDHGPIKFWLRD